MFGSLMSLMRRYRVTNHAPDRSNITGAPLLLDGAEHGRRMHVPASSVSSDRNAIDCPRLPLPLVSARDRDRACAQCARPIVSCTPPVSPKSS
jgi:hypothetical protein